MAAEELKNVTGFFVSMGSKDYPASYPMTSRFGFDANSDIPIYKYSLKDLIDGFVNPITLSRTGVNNTNYISFLVGEGDNNAGLSGQNLYGDDWKNVFKVLEWTAANQATILSITSYPEEDVYSNFPDYVFRNSSLDEKFNTNLVNTVPTYVNKSFYYVESSKKDRISYIDFKCKINNIPKQFKIYLDADDFMSAYAGTQFFVYYYQDLDDNDKISQNEFDKQIIDKINSGIMKEIYSNMKQYFTPYCKPIYDDADTGELIGHQEAVNRTFYVYSNLPAEEFTETIVVEQIRQQLIKDNNNSEDDLSNQYPNLFTDQEVHLYPIHDNTAIDRASGGGTQIVHPISYAKIQDVMKSVGLQIITGSDKFKNIELFYVGIDTLEKNTLNQFIYPILAADYSMDKTKLPISSRFINYSPRTFSSFDGTGSDDDKFQFILVNCLGYFEKHFEKDALLTNLGIISDNIDLKVVEADEGDYEKITFKMKNTLFSIIWYI